MSNEANTCRKFVVPKLQSAGWDLEPHAISEQAKITEGRIVPVGSGYRRKAPLRADYVLRYRRDFPIAVVEAKAKHKSVSVERLVALQARTDAIAKHITDFLKRTNRMAKTIIFCVDQEHALAMRDALNNLNADFVKHYPFYVCRVTAEEEDEGNTTATEEQITDPPVNDTRSVIKEAEKQHRKYYVDGGVCEIMGEVVSILDPDGKLLRTEKITDYTAEKVRTLYTTPENLLKCWGNPDSREDVLADIQTRGIDFETLRSVLKAPAADPLDLLLHVTFHAPLQTKRQRADKLCKAHRAFLESFQPEARQILDEILDKYTEGGFDSGAFASSFFRQGCFRHGPSLFGHRADRRG